MAASGYTPIQIYHSTTASAAPTAGNLVNGELAINILDGKLYYKDNGGTVQVIASKGTGTIGGSTTQVQYNNAGALAGSANFTFNGTTATINTLNLTNALGAAYGGTAQSTYAQGDLLYASAANTLAKLPIGISTYILTSNGTIPGWSIPSSVVIGTATNLAGGAAGSVPYQSGAGATTFLSIGTANQVVTSTGSAPQWSSALTLTGLSNSGLTTLDKTVTVGNTSFNGAAVFAPATPAKVYLGTGTVTDVTSAIAATNAAGAIVALGVTPIAATNANVTYTNASTLYIAGAPSAGTNITITNPYALYVAAGDAYFGGTVTAGTVNLTTLDLTNLEVTNIKAKDGTASMTLADSTGIITLSATAGTANGVAYLNGSRALTTGSALTFDGTNLLNDQSTASPIGIRLRNGSTSTAAGTRVAFEFGGTTTGYIGNQFDGGDFNTQYMAAQNHIWYRGVSDAMILTSTGLGIGTSNPGYKLDVESTTANPTVRIRSNGGVIGNYAELLLQSFNSFSGVGQAYIRGISTASGNSNTDLTFGVNASGFGAPYEAMRIEGSTGNVGIGANNPAQKLDVVGAAAGVLIKDTQAYSYGTSGSKLYFQGLDSSSANTTFAYFQGSPQNGNADRGFLNVYTRVNGVATQTLQIGTGLNGDVLIPSGNLGLGVTPSAWGSAYKAIDAASGANGGAAFSGFFSTSIARNAYNDGTNWKAKYTADERPALYEQPYAGGHQWFNGNAFVSAGGNVTFTQAMTLDASGNLGIGQTNPSTWLVNGLGIGSGANDWGATIYTGTASTGYLCFADGATGLDRYRGYISYAHATNAMVFATDATERARISSDGTFRVKGAGTAGSTDAIQFSGSAPANSLIVNSAGLLFFGGVTAQKAGEIARLGVPGIQSSILVDNSANTNGTFVGSFNDAALFGVNRNPSTGNFYDTSKYAASMFFVGSTTTSYIGFETSNAANTIPTERARITSDGNLLVGTTTNAGSPIVYGGTFPIRNINSAQGGIETNNNAGNTTDAGYAMRYIQNVGSGFHAWETSASLGAGAAISYTERARITSGGYFKASNAGTYNNSAGAYHELYSNASGDWIGYFTQATATNPNGVVIQYTAAAPNGTGNTFLYCNDNAAVRATIRSNGGLANYQSNNVDLSDARTKTDINPLASYWNKIAALEIVTYKYKDQTHDDLNIGVIAQQVEQVAPEFVDADGFGETPEDGVPLKTIYNKDLTFAAIKALQEAMARIEKLEAEVAALKGA